MWSQISARKKDNTEGPGAGAEEEKTYKKNAIEDLH